MEVGTVRILSHGLAAALAFLIGLSLGYDDIVMRGDPANRSFTLVYLNQGRVIALDCVNSVKDYVQGKALVLVHATPDKSRLSNCEIPLKTLAT